MVGAADASFMALFAPLAKAGLSSSPGRGNTQLGAPGELQASPSQSRDRPASLQDIPGVAAITIVVVQVTEAHEQQWMQNDGHRSHHERPQNAPPAITI